MAIATSDAAARGAPSTSHVDEESETRVPPGVPSRGMQRERTLADRIAARGMGAGGRAAFRARGAAHRGCFRERRFHVECSAGVLPLAATADSLTASRQVCGAGKSITLIDIIRAGLYYLIMIYLKSIYCPFAGCLIVLKLEGISS